MASLFNSDMKIMDHILKQDAEMNHFY